MKITDLDESFGRRYSSYNDELRGRERDEERAMGRGERDMSDESNLLYIYKDGRVMQKMVSNRVEREARAQGFRDTPEQALKMHGIVKSKFKPGKWVQKQGDNWAEVFPFGKPEGINEAPTAGSTSTASMGTVDAPQLSPGKARGKKSYIGSPSTGSGTKAPPQPRVVQPKTKAGTAVNALDMKGANLFGQAKESAVLKRR
jgi:hypothetical protein